MTIRHLSSSWLVRVIGILSLATLLVPLFVADSLFFPYITGKAIAFRALTALAVIFWAGLIWREPTLMPKRSIWLAALGVFIGVLTLSTFTSIDWYRSFWSNYERMEGLVTFLYLGAWALVLSTVFRLEVFRRWFWTTMLFVSGLLVLLAIIDGARAGSFNGAVRLDATLGNPIYLAVYMLFGLGVSAVVALRARSLATRLLLGILALGQLWALYATATRSAILGLIGGLIVAAVIFAWRGRSFPGARRLVIAFLAAVVVLTGGFWLARESSFVQGSPVLSRIVNISLSDATTRHRLMNWDMGWRGFLERPITGWGLENYMVVFSRFYNPELYDAEQWFDRTHNIYIDWLVSAGVLGLAAYLFLLATALYYIWKRPRSIAEVSVLSGLILAYAIHNIFVFDSLTSYMILFAGLAWLVTESSNPNHQEEPLINERGSKIAAVIFGVAAMVSLWWAVIVPWRGAQLLVETLNTGDPVSKLDYFNQAVDWGGPGQVEVREQLIQQSGFLLAAPAALAAEAQTLIDSEMKKEIDRSPTNVRALLFYGSYLRINKRAAEAIPYLERAVELSPTKQMILFELVYALDGAGRKTEALAVARKAYELAPKFRTAAEIYATWLGRTGQQDEARKILASLPVELSENLDLDEVNRQINSFIAAERYDLAASLWQKVVDEHPQNAEYRFRLAAARLLNGEKNKSIEELQAAVKIEPRLSKQVEFLISEIRAGRNPISK